LRGRWYRLAVRAFRKGIVDYGKWTGTRLDHHRERLLLEDLETEMLVPPRPLTGGRRWFPWGCRGIPRTRGREWIRMPCTRRR
jgi:hypothetical protein